MSFKKVLQNEFPGTKIRPGNIESFIKSAGPGCCRIEAFGEIGCCQNEDILVSIESVHFNKNLIKNPREHIVLVKHSIACDRVEFIEKDNRRLFGSCPLKYVLDFLHSWSLMTLLKKTSWNVLKVSVAFIGEGPGNEGLTDPRISNQEYSPGKLCSYFFVFSLINYDVFDLL